MIGVGGEDSVYFGDLKKYPEEFKREALKLASQPGMKVAQVERIAVCGITPGLIYAQVASIAVIVTIR